ncbi:MAG: DUF1993 family protein [Gammaproteobacteria bacterium]
MALTMYQVSVPVLARVLENLIGILNKAAAHAAARKIDPSVLLNYRLAPDMFPLSRQIQVASDQAKGGAARLAGVEPVKFEDNEAGFDELIERLRKTIDYIRTFKPEQIDGAEDRAIAFRIGEHALSFRSGLTFLHGFTLPNLYFHAATAYDILRHCGVELGKRDFIGGLQ